MQSLLTCPICKNQLSRQDRTYKCQSGHCFDISKEGYVNLLMSQKSTDTAGDDKQMVVSRTRFLDGGYYSPLRDKVCEIIKSCAKDEPVLLDSGCGEGYYTAEYAKLCSHTLGIDISKNALKRAAKRCKNGEFAACSVYHMPIKDESTDIIVNCFSPMAPEEFYRVLKKDGILIYVVPRARHLWQLKNVLYDSPYENEEKVESYEGFSLIDIHTVTSTFTLTSNEDIVSLFHMTPYTWTTPKDGVERLSGLESLDVTADFSIHVFRCTK